MVGRRATRRRSTWTGTSAAAGSGSPWSATTTAAAVEIDPAAGVVRYHDHAYPLAPGTTTLEEQHYELVSWRVADHGLNYRRFFAVNTLAGIRVEDRAVFDESHVEIGRWFDEGLVDGLRVDHPDGLRDPASYLDDLAQLTGGAYVLVEKILEPGEALEPGWATAGTTGYDVLGLVDRVLTDPAGQGPLTALDARLRGAPVDWHELIHDTKRAVADGILGSEVRRVVREVVGRRSRRSASHRRSSGVETTSHSRTPSPSWRPASRCTAPTSPPAASTSTRRSRMPAGDGPTSPRPSTSSPRCWATRRTLRPCASSRPAGR